MLILAYPPFELWPFVLAGWAGLFAVCFHGSPRSSFYLGMVFGMIVYGGTLAWLHNLFGTAAVPLHGILSLFIAGSCVCVQLLACRVDSPWLKTILAALIFSSFEFVRCELYFLKFPWMSAGSAMGVTWLTPIIGVYGSSLLIFTAAAFLSLRATRLAGIAVVIVLLTAGILRPPMIAPGDEESIRVAVVQGEDLDFDRFVELTRSTFEQSPRLVVWPEYAVPYDIRLEQPRQFAELQQLAMEHDLIFVIGTKTVIGKGEREWRNTALTIGKNGVLGEHHKNHTVHFFNDGIAGTNAIPVETPLGVIGAEVCFDCDFEDTTRELVRRGAEYVVVPTFDAEHWSETQHKQHAVFFQLRAAENGRWLICSASSGFSRIIDPHGHVHQSLQFAEEGAFVGRIVPQGGRTFYNRFGWLVPWITMVITVASSFVICLRGCVGRNRAGSNNDNEAGENQELE